MRHIKIGTRGSALALWQANWVKNKLENIFADCEFEIIRIETRGDRTLEMPLGRIGGEGVFVKQVEIALLNGEIDLAVHSMKDLPTVLPDGLMIGAIPERADPADVLISRDGLPLFSLPSGARVGTSSPRRRAQLLYARKDLVIVDIRGNVDTRLAKLKSGKLDAIVLAEAGIERMGMGDLKRERLPYDIFLPAVGQGALCVEIRADDEKLRDMAKNIDHPQSSAEVRAERAFLRGLGGGCKMPIAALATVASGRLNLEGLIADRDGRWMIRSSVSGSWEEPEHIGRELAELLRPLIIDRGAQDG